MEQLAQERHGYRLRQVKSQSYRRGICEGYLDWLSERDWPVGRQLWWGHQIPVGPVVR
ncbi:MAG: hypothetical protein U0892_10980 [Pirellulales bacterium]